MTLRGLSFRIAATTLLATLSAGCSTLINPYLSTAPLDSTTLCKSPGIDGKPVTCSASERFKTAVDGVMKIQDEARESYTQRAKVNSITSALAFPVAGVLLYRGITTNTDAGRRMVLKGGLAAGAVYEARNALTAGSPESVYIQAEARLGCVLDEASRYRVDVVPNCTIQTDALRNQMKIVQDWEFQNNALKVKKDALLADVRQMLANYENTEAVLAEATNEIRKAARKIVSDTNKELKTATISLSTASGLVKTNSELFSPVADVKPSDPSVHGKSSENDEKGRAESNKLVALANAYLPQCVRPQPRDTSTFGSCTTYNPNAPVAPTITTTLPANVVVMKKGDPLSFVASSQPSGTPWAVYAGNTSVAASALSPLHQITLSPTQTQVTLQYVDDTKVTEETQIIVSIGTLGTSGNSVAVTLKLQPKAGAPTTPAASDDKLAKNDDDWGKFFTDEKVSARLGLDKATATVAGVKAKLKVLWRTECSKTSDPTDGQLLNGDFFKKLAGEQINDFATKSPACTGA